MKLKKIYLIFTLLFIPGYIFYMPVMNYIFNFNKITYSLNIPENNIRDDSERVIKYKDIKISDDVPLKQIISESWVISFPDITSEELVSNFSNNFSLIISKDIIIQVNLNRKELKIENAAILRYFLKNGYLGMKY